MTGSLAFFESMKNATVSSTGSFLLHARRDSVAKYVGPYLRRRESVVKYVGPYRRRRESVVKYVVPYRRRRESVVKYIGF